MTACFLPVKLEARLRFFDLPVLPFLLFLWLGGHKRNAETIDVGCYMMKWTTIMQAVGTENGAGMVANFCAFPVP